MAKRFTTVKLDAFKQIQLEAGVIMKNFNPANPVINRADILFVTTGGINVNCKPNFIDYYDDVDNMPSNTKQGKQVDYYDCSIATTVLDVSPDGVKTILGAADIDANDQTRITPRGELKLADFQDLWWVGDKADGGFAAVQLLNALSTDGFSLKSTKKGKGNTAITLTGHYDENSIDTIPMVFYVVDGDDESNSIRLDKYSLSVPAGNDATITATTIPSDATVTWQSLDTSVATVADGVVTGVAAGTTQILAKFIEDDVTYSALCTVTVTASGGEG
jgi:hypothetical protein